MSLAPFLDFGLGFAHEFAELLVALFLYFVVTVIAAMGRVEPSRPGLVARRHPTLGIVLSETTRDASHVTVRQPAAEKVLVTRAAIVDVCHEK